MESFKILILSLMENRSVLISGICICFWIVGEIFPVLFF
uniref:Uncharacterized protein n=1 Tax=Arundo donax TaxID=35708 RepID=A0A0A9BT97_ARUDO